MSTETQATGWVISGFQSWVALWLWSVIVVLHALARSFVRPAADPIRPSGPVD